MATNLSPPPRYNLTIVRDIGVDDLQPAFETGMMEGKEEDESYDPTSTMTQVRKVWLFAVMADRLRLLADRTCRKPSGIE